MFAAAANSMFDKNENYGQFMGDENTDLHPWDPHLQPSGIDTLLEKTSDGVHHSILIMMGH